MCFRYKTNINSILMVKHCQKLDISPRSRPMFGRQPAFTSSTSMLVNSLFNIFFAFLFAILSFFIYFDRKRCKTPKKIISTSKKHSKHLLACQNTQQEYPTVESLARPSFEWSLFWFSQLRSFHS